MSIVLVGNPPFPAKEVSSCMVAKVEHIWHQRKKVGWDQWLQVRS